jgi:UDP-N-acetylmuramate dehydrogenase
MREGADMSALTSFRVGGIAQVLVEPADTGEIAACVRASTDAGITPIWFGAGTNVLVEGGHLHIAAVRFGERMSRVRTRGSELELQCGAALSAAAEAALASGLTGFEFAHGIPGSAGGGVYMNAGAYGGCMGDVVIWSECVTPGGEVVRVDSREHEFSYRHSAFMDNGYIVALTCVGLRSGDPAGIERTMADLKSRRAQSQPLDLPSAGSTFKRPEKGYAAALIESAGLKGARIGGAMVSEKHAGFIVNTGGASFEDITSLMRFVRQRVLDHSGILLEPEVRIIDREGRPWSF